MLQVERNVLKKVHRQRLLLSFFLNHLKEIFHMLKARVQTELWLEFFFLRPGQGLNPKVHFFNKRGRTKNDVDHPTRVSRKKTRARELISQHYFTDFARQNQGSAMAFAALVCC